MTTAPALATYEDITARMAASDRTRALAAIADASALIHAETGNAWVGDDGALVADVPAIAKTVCCKVVQRIITNPEGTTSESLGPFTESYGSASNDAYLTASERRILSKAVSGSAIGSVTLESPYTYRRPSSSDIYVPWIDEDSEAFPMGPFPSST